MVKTEYSPSCVKDQSPCMNKKQKQQKNFQLEKTTSDSSHQEVVYKQPINIDHLRIKTTYSRKDHYIWASS